MKHHPAHIPVSFSLGNISAMGHEIVYIISKTKERTPKMKTEHKKKQQVKRKEKGNNAVNRRNHKVGKSNYIYN